MPNNRVNFSPAVIRAVRDRAGNLCSQPKCRKPTVGADQSSDDGVKIIGIAAHILAASQGGARYNAAQTDAERCGIVNAIWLCASCSQLIDKNAGKDFSPEVLRRWKRDAEASSTGSLQFPGSLVRPDWLRRIHYAQFINVPRICSMLGNADILEFWQVNTENGLRGRGYELARLTHHVEMALERSTITALQLDEVMPPCSDLVGQVISFEHQCYTKNGVNAGATADPKLISNFDPKKSPHFYIKTESSKILFPYDPKWVTTSTAYCDFRGGHRRFAGLALVKCVSGDLREVVASPLVVAFPHKEWTQQFYSALSRTSG